MVTPAARREVAETRSVCGWGRASPGQPRGERAAGVQHCQGGPDVGSVSQSARRRCRAARAAARAGPAASALRLPAAAHPAAAGRREGQPQEDAAALHGGRADGAQAQVEAARGRCAGAAAGACFAERARRNPAEVCGWVQRGAVLGGQGRDRLARTDVAASIRRTLDALGRTGDTALTAFTDGARACAPSWRLPGSQARPPRTGSTSPCACSRQRQTSSPRSSACAGGPGTARPRMPGLPSSGCARSCPSLNASGLAGWKRALRAVDRHLRSQSTWLVNHAEHHRAGLFMHNARPTRQNLAWRPHRRSGRMTGPSPPRNPVRAYLGRDGKAEDDVNRPALPPDRPPCPRRGAGPLHGLRDGPQSGLGVPPGRDRLALDGKAPRSGRADEAARV